MLSLFRSRFEEFAPFPRIEGELLARESFPFNLFNFQRRTTILCIFILNYPSIALFKCRVVLQTYVGRWIFTNVYCQNTIVSSFLTAVAIKASEDTRYYYKSIRRYISIRYIMKKYSAISRPCGNLRVGILPEPMGIRGSITTLEETTSIIRRNKSINKFSDV